MKQIPLSKGKFALVDDEDYDFLMQWKWYTHSCGYAVRTDYRGGKNFYVYMHREIKKPPSNVLIDHQNLDKLDNRKQNLRCCTKQQNLANGKKRNRITASKYKGVVFFKRDKKWKAQITVNNKVRHIGLFLNEEDAAKAYDVEAKKAFGEFSRLNGVAA